MHDNTWAAALYSAPSTPYSRCPADVTPGSLPDPPADGGLDPLTPPTWVGSGAHLVGQGHCEEEILDGSRDGTTLKSRYLDVFHRRNGARGGVSDRLDLNSLLLQRGAWPGLDQQYYVESESRHLYKYKEVGPSAILAAIPSCPHSLPLACLPRPVRLPTRPLLRPLRWLRRGRGRRGLILSGPASCAVHCGLPRLLSPPVSRPRREQAKGVYICVEPSAFVESARATLPLAHLILLRLRHLHRPLTALPCPVLPCALTAAASACLDGQQVLRDPAAHTANSQGPT
ncbi:hypothetical protein ACCO45_006833 [Purpureocillium lilacinum]|uniref:Uncharacterized protein n=1 Tax=Purpureocillium lilacinum TaxID=33203 RepID=A0ACC4DR03_PURLI